MPLPALCDAAIKEAEQTTDTAHLLSGANLAARLNQLVATVAVEPSGLAPIVEKFPVQSLALTALSITLTTQFIDYQRPLAEIDPDRYLPDLAMSLNNLSNRLGEVLGTLTPDSTVSSPSLRLWTR